MVKACRKTKSKRTTLRKKYKIIRKVKEHHRKVRKEKKKNPALFKRKDPGIPHSIPFKEEVVKHVSDTKAKFEEIRKNQLLAAIKFKQTPRPVDVVVPKKGDSNLAAEFHKVVKESDVILEVVDARDPIGTRCVQAEQAVLAARKKLVVVLNKIDLVPRDNVKKWLEYFRQFYATLPFKANTQDQMNNLGSAKINWKHQLNLSDKAMKSNMGLGVDALLALLGNYARSVISGAPSTNKKDPSKGRLTVGIVGLPNTGKSALVNTLKRKKVTTSSNIPGQTRQAQLFQLDNHLYLYDSPGIVLTKCVDQSEMVLKNCLKPESLEDPHPAVEAILRRVPKRQLMVKYGVKEYASVADFLLQLATRTGKLKKGGVADTRAAARSIIHDWISGKITYHTLPPKETNSIEKDASSLPETILFDKLDMPLEKMDELTLSMTKDRTGVDEEFCPSVVLKDSQPVNASNYLYACQKSDNEMSDQDNDEEGDDSQASSDDDEQMEE